MTRPGIELRSPGPLANTPPVRPRSRFLKKIANRQNPGLNQGPLDLQSNDLPTELIRLGIWITLKELQTPKRHSNKKPLAYVLTYYKNNPELFIEITKNLEQLKNNDRIKNILDTTKIFKKTKKKHTMYGISECKNKRCEVCNITREWKSYTIKNQKNIIHHK